MLQNQQNFINDIGDEGTDFQRAYLEGRVGGIKVSAGRQELFLGDGNIYDTRFDGIILGYGKDIKIEGYYGKPTNLNSAYSVVTEEEKWLAFLEDGTTSYKYGTKYDKVMGAKLSAKLGVVDAAVAYDRFGGDSQTTIDFAKGTETTKAVDDIEIVSVQAGLNIAKNLNLSGIYMHADEDANGDDNGYVLTLSYGGAKAAKVGSFGLVAKYYDQPATTAIAHTMNGVCGTNGFDGYSLAGYYTVAKNIVAGVEWYDLESNDKSEKEMKSLWTQLVFTF